MPVTNSSLWSALWILPGLLTGILLLLNPDDHNVPQLQGALGSSQGLWLSHHGTKGSSLTTTSDSDRSKTEASKKNLSPRVHRLPGNVKWVRPHGVKKYSCVTEGQGGGGGGGGGGTYCARSRNDARPLTSRSNAMPSKKTMEWLEDVCHCRNCSKARPHVSR